MSDKQKGLIKAVEKFLPNAEHRFCLRHLYNNYKQIYKGLDLKHKLWMAATACRVVDFTGAMEQLKVMNKAAFEWLRERPPQNWSRSHFSTWPKSDMLLNNLCESFNKLILQARDKHIITMLETIRLLLMRRIHSQRDKILQHKGDICPNVQRIIENNKKMAREYSIEWNGMDQYEVKGLLRGDVRVVDLKERTCSCRKWDLTGIPCVHATVCIFHKRYRVEDYVEHWYRKSTFVKVYNFMINPMRGKEEWSHSEHAPVHPWAIPPPKVGRPKSTARRKEPDEKIMDKEGKVKLKRHGEGTKYNCSNCGKPGHNKKGCKEGKIKKESVPRETKESQQSEINMN